MEGSVTALTGGGSIGFSADARGNVALQKTGSGGITIPIGESIAGGSLTTYYSVTNAPTIEKLCDCYTFQAGASAGYIVEGVPLSAGIDRISMIDYENQRFKMYDGFSTKMGLGTPGIEAHLEYSITDNYLIHFNIFDVINQKCDAIITG